MLVEDFNIKYKRFRIVEVGKHTDSNGDVIPKYQLQEYFTHSKIWYRYLLPTSLRIIDGKIHADPVEKRISSNSFHVIVCNEKHGTYYFDARNSEAAALSSIKILKDRKENGCYDYNLSLPCEPEYKPDFFVNDLKLSKVCEQQWESYHENKKRYDFDKEFQLDVDKALEEKDYFLAIQCLSSRADYEYEGFELQWVESFSPVHDLFIDNN